MAQMTDPSKALKSFQDVYSSFPLPMQPGQLDPDVLMMLDDEPGAPRFTFVLVEDRIVIAFATLIVTEPFEGITCFALGYAVPPSHRNKGLAKRLVTSAIAELVHIVGPQSFCIEAVVSQDNPASLNVAKQTLKVEPRSITDSISDKPAYQFVKNFPAT